ncbi:GNAT family N-acetyltransferase [Janibacter terrae]|uniref:GNAT family N-acetyltransferase n=1 Tax=Janibacter terrae TaxID=103817 RepID=A0ABZ2FHL0_9MICO
MAELSMGPLRAEDAAALARLYRASFPDFFLARPGEPFLREFYGGFEGDPSAITVVAGTAAGGLWVRSSGRPSRPAFYRHLLRRRFPGLAVASARAAVRNPRTITRLVRGAACRGGVGDEGALLSSICTDPTVQCQGLGRRLVQEWEDAARQHGVTVAHLSTDAVDNEAVNALYDRRGWSAKREYSTREGRRMNLYTKDLRP